MDFIGGILLLDFYRTPERFTLLEDLFGLWLFRYSSLMLGSSPPGLYIAGFSKVPADLTEASFFPSSDSNEFGELTSFLGKTSI